MNGESLFTQIVNFLNELIRSFNGGSLFFGSGTDLIRYIADIIIVSFVFYWILRFLRESRAWQLIKGLILISLFVIVCSVFGLEMVGFIYNRFLYVFAFLFIVLFQPELRRALEVVGLKSWKSMRYIFGSNTMEDKTSLSSFINELCTACREMAKTYTGALILIERTTRLDELLTQENVVKFDSTVSSSVIQSIFYKGSPMHDGGLLIRDGRIVAARCHVPLSVTMHNLERSGTRHRAAVGASEMGDTVVVVVSEERGRTSIAVNGQLFEMKNAKELEVNLSYLLGLERDENEKKGIGRIVSRIRGKKNKPDVQVASGESSENKASAPEVAKAVAAADKMPVTQKSGIESEQLEIRTRDAGITGRSRISTTVGHLGLILLSILLSIGLWIYIQINTNPVITKTVTVPVTYSDENMPKNMEVSYPIETVDIKIVGRKETIDKLTEKDIIATIDYSNVTSAGVAELPVTISPKDKNVYFRVESQVPETISVTVYSGAETVEE